MIIVIMMVQPRLMLMILCINCHLNAFFGTSLNSNFKIFLKLFFTLWKEPSFLLHHSTEYLLTDLYSWDCDAVYIFEMKDKEKTIGPFISGFVTFFICFQLPLLLLLVFHSNWWSILLHYYYLHSFASHRTSQICSLSFFSFQNILLSKISNKVLKCLMEVRKNLSEHITSTCDVNFGLLNEK